MKSLVETILGMRKAGFHRETVELETLLYWHGERLVEGEERTKLKAEVARLQSLLGRAIQELGKTDAPDRLITDLVREANR